MLVSRAERQVDDVADAAAVGVRRLAATYLLGSLLFCWVALWNGYPLLYSDSAAYLDVLAHRHNLPDRPLYYGIFIGLLDGGVTLWPIVAAQALLAVFAVERTLAALMPGRSWRWDAAILLLLAMLTSLPWFTGQVMADVFTPLLVLALYLTAAARDRLPRWSWLALLLLVAVAASTHYTHIALGLGLLLVLAGTALLLRQPRRRDLLPAGAAVALAILAILTANYAARREVALSPLGSVFLLARLMEYGAAQDYLAAHCATEHYRICAYLPELPSKNDDFLWPADSVLARLGGAEAYRGEASVLAPRIIRSEPLRLAVAAAGATLRQLVDFGTGSGLFSYGPEKPYPIYRMITEFFPRDRARFMAARQYHDALDFPLVNAVQVPAGFAALAALAIGLAAAGIRGDRRLLVFLLAIAAALLGNAFLCGALSSGDARYQSRIMPLAVLAAAIAWYRLRPARLAMPVIAARRSPAAHSD
ncbi:MAG TPA: hypothetical protein VMU85_02060 [Stellaceae bacterium]|nr:hypothetical protein [Stellaceae bacterium]